MLLNIITIIALFSGPIAAVLITLWHQDRKQKIDANKRVFLTLMAHRKALPPNPEWVNALNLIDVIFHDCPQIVALWHEYFALLCQIHNWEESTQQREHKYLELLSAMAQSLGYRDIQQTDMDKFYSPKGQADLVQLQLKIYQELSRVLENTEHFLVEKKSDNEQKTPQ